MHSWTMTGTTIGDGATREHDRTDRLPGARAASSRATTTLAPFALAALAIVPACQSVRSNIMEERIDYHDHVVLAWDIKSDTRTLDVKNLGPGPVEAILQVRGGPKHESTLKEGEATSYVLSTVSSVEIRHTAPGDGHLELTVHKELRKDVHVTVD